MTDAHAAAIRELTARLERLERLDAKFHTRGLPWLRTGELAALVGVHRKTIHDWTREGKLEAFETIGGHLRYPVDAVRAARGIAEQVRA